MLVGYRTAGILHLRFKATYLNFVLVTLARNRKKGVFLAITRFCFLSVFLSC